MPKREQFFADLEGDKRQAALLVVQVGGMPQELQLITQIAEYDAEAAGLRPVRSYIIRVLGAAEHRVENLGMTVDKVQLLTEHPLLYQYNSRPTAVFFRGAVQNADALALDIAQAHASTFGLWRHFPQYLNTNQALATLFASGGGLIGQMPQPLADRIAAVLAKHGIEHKIMQDTAQAGGSEPPFMKDQQIAVLLFGSSYFVSHAFSFEEMRGRQKQTPET